MVAGPLAAGFLAVGYKYLAAWIGEKVMYDLRLELFSHVQRQSLTFFANAKPGEVVSRVLTDVQGVGQALQDNLVKLLQNALVLSVSVVLIVSLDWRLALVALSALPLFVLPARKVGRQRKQLKKETQARMAELTGILMETLSVSGVLLIKVFGARKRETRRLRGQGDGGAGSSLRQNLVGRWFQMLMKLFEDLGPAMVYGVGGYLVIRTSSVWARCSLSSLCSKSSTPRLPTWRACTSTSSRPTATSNACWRCSISSPASKMRLIR